MKPKDFILAALIVAGLYFAVVYWTDEPDVPFTGQAPFDHTIYSGAGI